MLLQTEIPWEQVAKLWGPLGLGFTVLLVLIVAAAKWFKATLEGTITDARKERDAARQYNEAMTSRFLESLDKRDDVMERGFDEVLKEIRDTPRRK